jgi:hypothetical protein
VALDNWLKISKSLNFVQQWCVGGWKLEQLDGKGVAAVAKSDWKKCRFARRHADAEGANAVVGRASDGGGRRIRANGCHVTEDAMQGVL